MSMVMPWLLLLLLLLVSFGLPAPRLSDKDICLLDNNNLKQKLKLFQGLLHLYELQLKDLLENNYHRTKSKVFSVSRSRQPVVLLPPTSGNLIVYDQDCSAVFNSKKTENGYYRIRPNPEQEPFLVYCDMSDGGGWTVIQRRSNGRENFNRKWADYKLGFGRFQSKNDEYWLGNDRIHDLLVREENMLKIDLMDWHGEKRYAIYENFQIKNEQDNYRLWFGTYSGNAGDALSGGSNFREQWSASHSGMQFTTSDKDHDRFLTGNCAKENNCGWWFNRCHAANLNGQYYKGGNYTGQQDNGVVWSSWHGFWYSLKYAVMKVRLPSFVNIASGSGENS
ncbi:PREDICTED: fibrinogen-like protein 1 [Gavialis gangeticus]|uniref:fibrinogen-like protein 1 n=1 Tax=Gavialis gangeticus TaxID=94835 RepID=UPI00092FBD7C|nr:PREDICTED: fibrinogen-like protein 1 [Gavialis gangeticus]XP_019379640.1 PREDICTED: fibrinogen-like protein 1 [Gavialis gangeticus]XP_019379641.1 PREDICTED: fibrinogen-like protein 1 [Gavialis gangeticus]XP_019379642.1 PREDICTED: fibrinogen-like protein 1 [Gavialis gangeticus]